MTRTKSCVKPRKAQRPSGRQRSVSTMLKTGRCYGWGDENQFTSAGWYDGHDVATFAPCERCSECCQLHHHLMVALSSISSSPIPTIFGSCSFLISTFLPFPWTSHDRTMLLSLVVGRSSSSHRTFLLDQRQQRPSYDGSEQHR